MAREVEVVLSDTPFIPPLFVDGCEIAVHVRDGRPQHVMLLAINLSPFHSDDGRVTGQITGKWVMTVDLAEKLLSDLQEKLSQARPRGAEDDGNTGDSGESDGSPQDSK